MSSDPILWVGNLIPEQNSSLRIFIRPGETKVFSVYIEVYAPFVTDAFGNEGQIEAEVWTNLNDFNAGWYALPMTYTRRVGDRYQFGGKVTLERPGVFGLTARCRAVGQQKWHYQNETGSGKQRNRDVQIVGLSPDILDLALFRAPLDYFRIREADAARKILGDLASLGLNTLQIRPFFATDHEPDQPYTSGKILDFIVLEPQLGTTAELQGWVNEAHEQGFKVIMEINADHVSRRHPFLLEALNDPGGSRYARWFAWEKDGTPLGHRESEGTRVGAELNFGIYNDLEDTMEPGMHDPSMWDYFSSVVPYWIHECGFDGACVVPTQHTPELFWTLFINNIKELRPNYLVLADSNVLPRFKPEIHRSFDGTATDFHQTLLDNPTAEALRVWLVTREYNWPQNTVFCNAVGYAQEATPREYPPEVLGYFPLLTVLMGLPVTDRTFLKSMDRFPDLARRIAALLTLRHATPVLRSRNIYYLTSEDKSPGIFGLVRHLFDEENAMHGESRVFAAFNLSTSERQEAHFLLPPDILALKEMQCYDLIDALTGKTVMVIRGKSLTEGRGLAVLLDPQELVVWWIRPAAEAVTCKGESR